MRWVKNAVPKIEIINGKKIAAASKTFIPLQLESMAFWMYVMDRNETYKQLTKQIFIP